MIRTAIKRLHFLNETIPQLLYKINEPAWSLKSHPDKWSKIEILGHLIDSATNNHHRFVRGQFEENAKITYDQNNWNKYNFYSKIKTAQVIAFWEIYNKQLAELLKNITAQNFSKNCEIGDNQYVTLEFVLMDYVKHLEHHLKQIVDYT